MASSSSSSTQHLQTNSSSACLPMLLFFIGGIGFIVLMLVLAIYQVMNETQLMLFLFACGVVMIVGMLFCCVRYSNYDNHDSKEREQYIKNHIICKKVKEDPNWNSFQQQQQQCNGEPGEKINFPLKSVDDDDDNENNGSFLVDIEAQFDNKDGKSIEQDTTTCSSSMNSHHFEPQHLYGESISSSSPSPSKTTTCMTTDNDPITTSNTDITETEKRRYFRKGSILIHKAHQSLPLNHSSESSRSSSRNKILQKYSSTLSSIYSPKSCSICCERYKVGDDICWSKNDKCNHVYHVDCLTHWLMTSNDCPLCRANYLV